MNAFDIDTEYWGMWWEPDLVMFSLGTASVVVVQSVRFGEIRKILFVFQQYQVDRYTWNFQGSENKLCL